MMIMKGTRSKRDRLTFRVSNTMGMQMQTEKQIKTKKASKVLGYEAFQAASKKKPVSSLALVSSMASNMNVDGSLISINSPNRGSFQFEMHSKMPTILAPINRD